MSKEEGVLTYDKVVQFLAPVAWVVLGLLGWSLDAQIGDFKDKIGSVETNVDRLTQQHASVVTDVAEFKVRQEGVQDRLGELSVQGRERGNQIERMNVIVNELLEIRREERQSSNGFAARRNGNPVGDPQR